MVMKLRHRRWLWVAGIAVGCSGGAGDDDSDGTETAGTTATATATATGGTSTTGGTTAATETSTTSATAGTTTTATSGSSGEDSESSTTGPVGPGECGDGIDNDGDGLVDWQEDFGCYGPADQTEGALPREQEDGFTTYDFPADSVVVYVSNDGDDAADGLTPATAVATLTHAAELVRDGEHDFILLRRGDAWRDQGLYRFKSGKDAGHPLVIGGYGDSTVLPRIEVADHLIDHDGKARSFVALIGLHIVSYPGDPNDPGFTGAPEAILRYVGGGAGLLVEGCHLEYGEIVVQSIIDGTPYEDVEIRRNVVERAYHSDTCLENDPNGNPEFRPSGLYSSHAHRLTIEGNLFDHNGWNPDADPTACATIYNHNLYVNGTDMVIRDNLLARASSIHIKLRSDATGDMEGLLVDNNFFVEGEIGVSLGGNSNEPYRFVDGELRGNVLTDIGRSQPTGRTLAWGIDITDNDGLTIADNLILNNRAPGVGNAYGLNIGGGTGRQYQVENNLFWRLQSRAIRVTGDPGHMAIAVTDNTVVDPEFGGRLVDFSGSFAGYAFAGNDYYSSADPSAWFAVEGQGQVGLAEWEAASGEA
ncbi:MAG: right-handed parallel beta-helix repeat-containing protein, partial [Myxococcales bacterium]|nr:right-handed parallel beta-helix repeat-containing protein [Myxococcales bacterium]